MEVRLASFRGFCFGVRHALDLIEAAAKDHGRLATIGPLVHNRQVVERLSELGVRVVGEVNEAEEPVVAISAHGAPPRTGAQVEALGRQVVDGTCPFVRKAQNAARDLAAAGFAVLVLGDPAHREVQGILGWAGGRAQVVASADLLPSECPGKKLGIVAQTTQNESNLQALVRTVVDRWFGDLAELRVINTICDASVRRQQAAEDLAAEVEVMVVIGGRESANTRRLAEVCARTGTPTYQIELAEELLPVWFQGRAVVGVTAGASTPDWVIEQVVERLRTFH